MPQLRIAFFKDRTWILELEYWRCRRSIIGRNAPALPAAITQFGENSEVEGGLVRQKDTCCLLINRSNGCRQCRGEANNSHAKYELLPSTHWYWQWIPVSKQCCQVQANLVFGWDMMSLPLLIFSQVKCQFYVNLQNLLFSSISLVCLSLLSECLSITQTAEIGIKWGIWIFRPTYIARVLQILMPFFIIKLNSWHHFWKITKWILLVHFPRKRSKHCALQFLILVLWKWRVVLKRVSSGRQ